MSTIRIISTKKIEVIRALAYSDKTPDIVKEGTVVGTGNFMRVMTHQPVSYSFKEGSNTVPEPYTFKDPVTREEVTESILEWPAVKSLIASGVFEVFLEGNRYTGDEKTPAKKGNKKPAGKSLGDIAEEVAEATK